MKVIIGIIRDVVTGEEWVETYEVDDEIEPKEYFNHIVEKVWNARLREGENRREFVGLSTIKVGPKEDTGGSIDG